jgi:hypothetical protein
MDPIYSHWLTPIMTDSGHRAPATTIQQQQSSSNNPAAVRVLHRNDDAMP